MSSIKRVGSLPAPLKSLQRLTRGGAFPRVLAARNVSRAQRRTQTGSRGQVMDQLQSVIVRLKGSKAPQRAASPARKLSPILSQILRVGGLHRVQVATGEAAQALEAEAKAEAQALEAKAAAEAEAQELAALEALEAATKADKKGKR